jgi:AcrR family transcriptional regulator
MPRSGAEARARLREAALELYSERGFDETTAAQIAARAGVTERTYFRHFPDKREVLFDGESELRSAMVEAIESAERGTTALGLVVRAYRAAVPLFVAGRPIATRRAAIIAATPALQERAHAKTAALLDAVVSALSNRGVPSGQARLVAQIGGALFDRAAAEWNRDPSLDLAHLIESAADEVRHLASG